MKTTPYPLMLVVAFCALVVLVGKAHAQTVVISDFDNFTSDALYDSWGSATIVSGPASYSITATGYGSNYKYIGFPEILGVGNTEIELMLTLDGPPAADGELGPIVDLIDGDGTRYSYRWYGQHLGNHVLTSPVESPFSVLNAGTTSGLDLNTLTHMHMQLDPGGFGTTDAYTVEWENLSLTSSDPNPDPMKVYMHYMPWFETPDTLGGSTWGWHWKMNTQNPNMVDGEGRRQIASHYYPKIGPYASRDADVIEYHMLLMKYGGVDGVLIDWYGVQGSNGDIGNLLTSSDAIVDQTDDFGMEFGVVLEDRFSTSINDGKANVAYLRDNYFNRPEHIRYGAGDDPLMMVFGPITFQQESEWTQILAEAGEDVEFLTLWYESGDAGSNADGEYSWIYEDEALDNYAGHLQNFYANRAPTLGTPAGSAFPGFNDFYQEGGLGNVVPFDIPHDDGQTLATTLALADQYKSEVNLLQLATWNDFGEGTIFEPTVETGFDYLLQLQQFTGVPFGEAELQLVFDLYRARKEFNGDAATQALLDQASAHLTAFEIDDAVAIIEGIYPPGDFDGDADNDGADFLQWQRQFGSTGLYPLNTLDSDGNADGIVDGGDQIIWESNYGWKAPLATNSAAVPEPSTYIVLLIGMMAMLFRRDVIVS